jgi:hypothetical protein
MDLLGTAVRMLGFTSSRSRALSSHLSALGAALDPEGPADYLFHCASFNKSSSPRLRPGGFERAVVEPVRRAARDASRLRHICLVREAAPLEPATPKEVHLLAVEDGLRFVAGRHGVPVAVLHGPRRDPCWKNLPAAAAIAACLRLSGEFDMRSFRA